MSINLYSLAPARNIIIYPFLVPVGILHSLPLLHVFNNLVIIPKPLATDGIFDGCNGVAM